MEETQKDGAAVRLPPPLVYFVAAIVGGTTQAYGYPLSFSLAAPARWGATGVLAACGIALMAAAFGKFKATGQDPKPWKPTPEIIAGGIYRYTRNPMYLAMALLQAAIGMGFLNPWIIALVPVSLVLVYFTAIRHEEAYLERKFGESYLGYKRSVRRWI